MTCRTFIGCYYESMKVTQINLLRIFQQKLSSEKMELNKEAEILFSYCLEELRLLIERPYENNALIERLSTIKNKLELLYQQTLLKEEVN